MPHKVHFYQDEDGAWIARVLDLKGVHSAGDTLDEARSNVRWAIAASMPEDEGPYEGELEEDFGPAPDMEDKEAFPTREEMLRNGFVLNCGRDEPTYGLTPARILRRTFRLASWRAWDTQIHGFIGEFRTTFGVTPNVLLANSITHTRIDMAAKKENLVNAEGEKPAPGEYAVISSFSGEGYSLMFAVDEALEDRCVSLIFDSDPDGGGEPIPDVDTDEEGQVKASAA